MMGHTLNLFYQEPDPDRWVTFDRYPRKVIRRLVRGKHRPGGQEMVFINLMKGLDKLNIDYRVNDFSYAKKHPNELACIIGKPHLLFERKWKNPILFGASVYSHPSYYPDLFNEYPNVRKILVPGEWIRKMFEPVYGEQVVSWPVGIDTEKWTPSIDRVDKPVDILIYDKVRWKHEEFEKTLINPVLDYLKLAGMTTDTIRYGYYNPSDLKEKVIRAKGVIFLCEHETQGLAYQQILSAGVPILAWNRGGYWQDPSYFPHKVNFQPVSSVPYWDERCGMTFKNYPEFESNFAVFWKKVQSQYFQPREYILENLTLEKCARKYLDIVKETSLEL